MANYRTLATNESEYRQIIKLLENGFTDATGTHRKPNKRAAFALKLEKVTGLRIGDVVTLKPSEIVRDGSGYRMDRIEEKTQKRRTFLVSASVYACIMQYCHDNSIGPDDYIIGVTERAIQKQLKIVVDALQLRRVSTHSVRKMAAEAVYNITGGDIVATSEFLQHADTKTTKLYLNHAGNVLQSALLQLTM